MLDKKRENFLRCRRKCTKKVLKDCSFYERIVFKIFKKEFVKVFKLGITFGFNNK